MNLIAVNTKYYEQDSLEGGLQVFLIYNPLKKTKKVALSTEPVI